MIGNVVWIHRRTPYLQAIADQGEQNKASRVPAHHVA
jgi:hypothetical protein